MKKLVTAFFLSMLAGCATTRNVVTKVIDCSEQVAKGHEIAAEVLDAIESGNPAAALTVLAGKWGIEVVSCVVRSYIDRLAASPGGFIKAEKAREWLRTQPVAFKAGT